MKHAVSFDPATAYIAVYTKETQARLDQKLKGRPRYRYDIVARKKGLPDTVFLEDLTLNELQTLRSVAEAQGTKIW